MHLGDQMFRRHTIFVLIMGLSFHVPISTMSPKIAPQWAQHNTDSIYKFAEAIRTQDTDQPYTLAIVSDLHDVALDRIPGDLQRFSKLSWRNRLSFIRYVSWYGLKRALSLTGVINRPPLEASVLDEKMDEQTKQTVLNILSPFAFNSFMAKFFNLFAHKESSKVFGFSNIEQHSLNLMQTNHPLEFGAFTEIQTSFCNEEKRHVMKNDPHAYELFLQKLRNHYGGSLPQVIFYMDDKARNLDLFKKVLREQEDGKGVLFLPYRFTSVQRFEQELTASFRHCALPLVKLGFTF